VEGIGLDRLRHVLEQGGGVLHGKAYPAFGTKSARCCQPSRQPYAQTPSSPQDTTQCERIPLLQVRAIAATEAKVLR
jgi:hypothetical protein